MNTKKIFYGILTFCFLLAAACTSSTAEDELYELGIDKKDVDIESIDKKDVEIGIDKKDVEIEAIDKNDVEID